MTSKEKKTLVEGLQRERMGFDKGFDQRGNDVRKNIGRRTSKARWSSKAKNGF